MKMCENNKLAWEFEALICEVQAISAKSKAMETANEQRQIEGKSLAYGEGSFWEIAHQMEAMASKFREIGNALEIKQ